LATASVSLGPSFCLSGYNAAVTCGYSSFKPQTTLKTNCEIAATSKVERGHLTRNMDVTQLLLCRGEKKKIDFEEDPLQVPDDIIVAVEESKKSGDHSGIHEILNNRAINLRSRIEEDGEQRTILKKLLDDAVNGDKIVERQLDKNVEQVGVSENSVEHGTQIEFEGIFKDGSPRQTRVVKELLDLRACSTEGEQRDAYTRLSHFFVALHRFFMPQSQI